MNFLINRLKEDNTYVGLFMIAGAFFGLDLSDQQQTAVMYFGMAMVAAPEGNLKRVLARKK